MHKKTNKLLTLVNLYRTSSCEDFRALISHLYLDIRIEFVPMVTAAMCIGSVNSMWIADPCPRQAVTRSAEIASQHSISDGSNSLIATTRQYGCPTIAILMAYAFQVNKAITNTRFDPEGEYITSRISLR